MQGYLHRQKELQRADLESGSQESGNGLLDRGRGDLVLGSGEESSGMEVQKEGQVGGASKAGDNDRGRGKGKSPRKRTSNVTSRSSRRNLHRAVESDSTEDEDIGQYSELD